MKKINSIGQESAPFELLVAVTLMTFVILAGLNAMNYLSSEKCKKEAEAKLEGIKTALETVSTGKGISSAEVFLPNCFKNEAFYIKKETSKNICSRRCLGTRENCVLLFFRSEEHSDSKCLNVSPNITFQSPPACDIKIGSELMQISTTGRGASEAEVIKEGLYSFVWVQSFEESTQGICAYRKTFG